MSQDQPPSTDQLTGLVLSDDLMFASRITGTARALGLSFKVARSPDVLKELAQQQPPRCVILDLANAGATIGALVESLRSADADRPFLVAYGSHVDAATLQRARDAGCDVVLPRSKFVEELPAKLAEWAKT